MELRDALAQISEIRQQVARGETFRGYRALPLAFSGALALVGGVIQSTCIVEPTRDLRAYFTLWIGLALFSLLATGWELAARWRRCCSLLEREKIVLAVTQFLPCLVAGTLLWIVLARFAPESVWMLPGLWCILFGLGIFASWRFLPPAILWSGVFYLVAGFLCLAWAQREAALSPWAMALPFGVGQLLTAAILYWNLERQ